MKVQKLQIGLALSLLACQLAVSAPEYIADFSSFPAFPYNTAAYKQGGAFVGCGPTTGAMMFAYFQSVHSLTGLLVDPGVTIQVNEGLNTAWELHGSQYMKTLATGFGDVNNIKSGLEKYANDRGFSLKVVIHVGPSYSNPNSADAAWLNAYGTFGDAWTNDGAFWIKNANGTWKIDAEGFCDFLTDPLSMGIPVFLTIDSDGNGDGDHWVPLVGFDRSAKKYAFYNTYDTALHWADIYYMADPAGHKVNSISMVRTVELILADPDIAVDLPSMNFGSVAIGANSMKYLTVSNTGAGDLVVTETDHSGPNAADFSILNGGPFTLAPGNARQIGVKFTPSGSGSRSATMVLYSNDPDENPLEIALSGTGGGADPLQWVKGESPGGGDVNAIAVMGENLFAGTEYGGVYLSIDRGATWNPVNAGLPNLCVRSVLAHGTLLFAGTWGDGVYCSADSGGHWNPAGTGMGNLFVTSFYAESRFGVVQPVLLTGTWGGVFQSSDNGQTWTGTNSGLTETHVRSVMIADGIFFAGTIDGLYRSPDAGQTWSAANNGLTNTAVISLTHRGIHLYAGTDGGGVFHSANAGDLWEPFGPGMGNAVVPYLAKGSADLYAATWGAGVFVKPHDGENWNSFNAGLTEANIRSIAVRIGTRENDLLLAGTESGEIWRKRLDEGFAILVDGERDDFFSMLAGPDFGALNLRSYAWNDNGKPDSDDDLSARIWTAWDEEWFYLYEEVTDDLLSANATNVWEEDCLELKIDPQPTDSTVNLVWETRLTALWGLDAGVAASDDMNNIPAGDKQWVRQRVPGGYVLELAFHWATVQSGAETITPAEGTEFGMAINQHDNDGEARRVASVQWAAVLKDAVWNTPKYMGTVKLLPDHRMQFTPNNKMTGVTNPVPYDGSDYSRDTGVRENGVRPATLSLGQNYPNPFNPSTTISYSLPGPSEVRLSVIDILGREVAVPVYGHQQAGVHRVTFEAGKLSSGMYFYRLEAGATVLIHKMIIER